ncbi:hypothetical protein ACWDBF_17065 [Streptomyces angustmyceticus]
MDSPTVEAAVDPFAGTPYEGSPDGPWTLYGGALDVTSGVVYIPRPDEVDLTNRPICHRPSREWRWRRL